MRIRNQRGRDRHKRANFKRRTWLEISDLYLKLWATCPVKPRGAR